MDTSEHTALGLLGKLFGRQGLVAPPARRRLVADHDPSVIYAMGDVHGRLDLLLKLERRILDDARHFDEDRWLILLGDVIDRGPASADVVSYLTKPSPSGVVRLVLAGNHEQAMLDFIDERPGGDDWLRFGGVETLLSYGLDIRSLSPDEIRLRMQRTVSREHIAVLRAMPSLIETPSHIFAHAGLRPGVPLPDQRDADLQWWRDGLEDCYGEFGKRVVHGHTPVDQPMIGRTRIDIDTGAYASGRLSAVRLVPGEEPFVLSVGASV